MLTPVLLSALLLQPDTTLFSGRVHQLDVEPPRFEQVAIEIDGVMAEPEWNRRPWTRHTLAINITQSSIGVDQGMPIQRAKRLFGPHACTANYGLND